MADIKRTVATQLSYYYKQKDEKMPIDLKLLLFNYNIESIPYDEFVRDIKICAGPDGEESDGGNIDGDEEKEVVRFILDPDNSYILGKLGHTGDEYDLHPASIGNIITSYGQVANEERLLLK